MALSLSTVFWIFLIVFLGWFWWKGKAIKEYVLQAAKQHCQKMDVMLLDDAVYGRGLWFKRDDEGKLRVWRRFYFDFTSTGEERYRGTIVMLGYYVQHIELQPHRFS